VSAAQLKIGEEAIKLRLKGMKYRLYKRICANIGVYSSGNEVRARWVSRCFGRELIGVVQVRMGKGKGSFDHWASRVAVSKVIFEIRGDIHEQVARDAFRLAGNKMPGTILDSVTGRTTDISVGMYEFVKKGDPAVVGITKLDGVTLEELKRPRRLVPLPMPGVPNIPPTTTSTSASLSPDA